MSQSGFDLSQFYGAFYEEAFELLGSLESLVLDLDLSNPSNERLNAIFRVAHSIKGGASTFGFTEIAEVTHAFETLLDKLRRGELALRAEMLDAFLRAGDVIGSQLNARREESESDGAAAAAIKQELITLADSKHAVPESRSTSQAAPARDVQSGAASSSVNRVVVTLHNTPADVRWNDVLQDFQALGAVSVHERAGEVPRVFEIVTDSQPNMVRELLEFFLPPAAFGVALARDDHAAQSETTAAQAKGDEQGFGFFEPLASVAPALDAGSPRPAASGASVPTTSTPATQPITKPSPDKPAKSESSGTAQTDTSIRVSVEKVDQLINLVGELVITQAMLAQSSSKLDPGVHENVFERLAQLERNTRDLQEAVMSIRMLPIAFAFSRFPRMVRDLSKKLGKEIELVTEGESTELDKGVIEKITDPLMHLVRNSMDHGIELPEERERAGKPRQGRITLSANHQGGNIVIEVADDGRGIHRAKVLAKARERGLPVSENMSDTEVCALIFEPGFSTAEAVTDVSGRGVGMDVVMRNIRGIGGRVDIESTEGRGTWITIRLPLTLAILDGISVAVGDERFIIPLGSIVESLKPTAADIGTVVGEGKVLRVRGEYLPIVALHRVFNIAPRKREIPEGILVVIEAENRRAALFVDDLVGQHQVVIKSLETNYRRVFGVSGATIMGDGRVSLILDVAALIQASQSREQRTVSV